MFGWGEESDDIDRLIAKKKYPKAVQLVREALRRSPESVRLQQRLADLYILEERPQDAVPILLDLANDFVRAGFDAKGIALLKKARRIDPGQPRVEEQLASLIRRRYATADLRPRLPRGTPLEGVAVPPAAKSSKAQRRRRPKALPLASAKGSDLEITSAATVGASLGASLATSLETDSEFDGSSLHGVRRSPLFSDVSLTELIALIEGLELKTFDGGEIVVTEGEPGGSLFVLASGAVRVYVRNTWGRSEAVRLLRTGAVFGEISLITNQPRTATVVTCCPCEILELDRPGLDRIALQNPQVPQVIRTLHDRRINSPEELEARGELPTRSWF